LSSEEAARRMIIGITKRKKYLHFPKRLTFLMKILSILPSSLWQSLIISKNKTEQNNTMEDEK
ncbi:MAG TPA: short-chain dehydrogenase, partial [Colwellia sp.]|nr:short-chain dehydrogenase [Colwellia sp.]